MPDEHVQWERVSNQPPVKADFEATKRTEDVRRKRGSKENPHRYEAEHDRLLLRWGTAALLLLGLIALLVWQIWFD